MSGGEKLNEKEAGRSEGIQEQEVQWMLNEGEETKKMDERGERGKVETWP